MKALGIVRRIDNLGRIVIPKELRNTQGWRNGTAMEMFMSEEGLVIREYGDKNEELVNVLEEVKALVEVDLENLKVVYQLEHLIEKYSV
jgi:AbrB family looped-hinge helix DNA binding protein